MQSSELRQIILNKQNQLDSQEVKIISTVRQYPTEFLYKIICNQKDFDVDIVAAAIREWGIRKE